MSTELMVVAISMDVLWLGIVAVLASIAARRGATPGLRIVMLSTIAVCCAATVADVLALVLWPSLIVPTAPWGLRMLFITPEFVCFGVALCGLIYRGVQPRPGKPRRLHFANFAVIGALNLLIFSASMYWTDWWNMLFLLPYGILLATWCVWYCRAIAHVEQRPL